MDSSELKGRLDVDQVYQALPQFIDALNDAVLMLDRDRRIVAANRRYLEAFGGLSPDLIGSRCADTLNCSESERGLEPTECAGCHVLRSRTPQKIVRSLPGPDGVLHRWEATLSPVLDEDGELTHVVEVWRDITDRSRLESQLSHSERLASLGILAAGVAHEINNPMASILAGVESLRRWLDRETTLGAEHRDEMAEILEILESATGRCSDTTEKLLLLAQPYQVAPTLVDLNAVIRDTVSLLGYQTRHGRVVVHQDLDDSLPRLWARDGGIRSVCMNLCLNAVQAMTEGGTMTVRTKRRGDIVVMEVLDTGPGIDPAILPKIWDPFFTTKPVGQGTGLGLSITNRIVERHGGTVTAENTGQGACFRVRWPLGEGRERA